MKTSVNNTIKGQQKDYGSFTISDWEMMPNTSVIIMRKVLDHTITEDTGIGLVQVTEKGIIEIRKN